MASPFEDVAFLASSRNRVAVLETLAERSRDRHALQEELGISQPTASRILRDLREREWVTRTGHLYEPTPVGTSIAGAFAHLLEQIETIHHLHDVVPLFPEDGFDFDLARLRTADVVQIEVGTHGLAWSHEVAQLSAADRVRILTDSAPRRSVEAVWRQVTGGEQRFELVVESGTIADVGNDPELRRWHHEMLASGRARMYRYDGDITHPVLVTDDTVHLALPRTDAAGGAWISTADETVLAWAEVTFEEHRARAAPLTEDDFAA